VSTDRLPPRDLEFARTVLPRLRGALQAYFDSSVDGLEKIPEGPALIVANHSGGSTPVESIVFVVEYLDRLGVERPLYWLGHDALLRLPIVGDFVRRCGVIPAGWDVAADTLRAGGQVVVYPGGELDLHRPWTARNEIRFEGRSGFIALARDAGVPIVPVVATGGQNTYLPVSDGRGLAKALGIDRLVRLKVLPVAFALPWGVSIGPLPHLPLPARVGVQVLDPIDVSGGAADEDPTAYADIVATRPTSLDELVERVRERP
jgi:1-acyl-sn-glycerol-3-phosphate acyltransferase